MEKEKQKKYEPRKHPASRGERPEREHSRDRRPKPAPESITEDAESGAVIGRNAVRELLKTDRSVDKLLVQRGERNGSIVVLVAQAIEKGIPVIETDKNKLDALAGFAPHQGVIAFASEKEYCTLEDILSIAKERGEDPLVVVCDGITDPYNLGAIIRCAECCGAHGVVIPKRRAVGVTPLVTRASAGAVEHMAVAKVPNIAAAVEELKKNGVWTYAAEAGGSDAYKTDFRGPCALILGSEGEGVSALVKKTCDGVVSIPMYGSVNSFNVSAAAAILLSQIAHQNHAD